MAQSILSGLHRTTANLIPLIMRKQQMDWEQEKWDLKQQQEEEELAKEAEKAEIKMAVDFYKMSYEKGDKAMAQSPAQTIEKLTNFRLPKEQLTAGSMGGPMRDDTMGGMAIAPLEQYLVPEKEPKEETFKLDKTLWDLAGGDFNEFAKMKQSLTGKDKKLPSTIEALMVKRTMEGQPLQDLVDLKKSLAAIKGRKEARAVKPYMTPDGRVEFLPNNVTPKKGWKPYTTGNNFIKHQELLSLREQKRAIRRNISILKRERSRWFGLTGGESGGFAKQKLEQAEAELLPLQDELEELRQREKEILRPRSENDPFEIWK